MKKTILLLILVLLLVSVVIHGEKAGVLPELMKPTFMAVDDTQFYATEGASIYIYSLKEFKLVKKFGKAGQGPQEFQVNPLLPLTLDVSGKEIIVFSILKVSYFTKKADYIKEIRAPGLIYGIQTFGDRFLGSSITAQDNVRYRTISLYDSKLNKLKEIFRIKDSIQGPGQGTRVLEKTSSYQGYENKIFLPGNDDASINVFDSNMKKLFTIHLDQKKIKIDQEFKDAVINYFKTTPGIKESYNMLKPIIFPEYFPQIVAFFVIEDIIYVMTMKKENNRVEFFTYDMKGKFKKRLLLPIQFETPINPYPLAIHKGKLYQIVENEEEEEWELYITEIK